MSSYSEDLEKGKIINNFASSVKSMIGYDGIDEEIGILKDAMKHFKPNEKEYHIDFRGDDAYNVIPEIHNFNTIENFLGGVLCEMFGDCGTSPRVGGIDNKKIKQCIKFLESVIEDYERSEYE